MNHGVVRQVHALAHRRVVGDLERQPAHGIALGRTEAVVALRHLRPNGAEALAAVVQQAADEPAPDEAVGPGDQDLHGTRSRSASTIIVTSCAKLTLGAQPRSRRACPASASKISTSAGRTKRASTLTYCCQSRPTCPKATSHSSRTECVPPEPIT